MMSHRHGSRHNKDGGHDSPVNLVNADKEEGAGGGY